MTERIITDSNGRKHITTEPLLHPPQRTWVSLTEQEHITDGGKCWCDPELDYKDPNTGVEVWIHKDLQ